jgi:DNA primase
MANMSYCRFRNTAENVKDCLNALDPNENEYEITSEEVQAGRQMFIDFLEYCGATGIIEEYSVPAINGVFDECNAFIRNAKQAED